VWRRAGQELFAEGVAEPLLETPDRPLPVVGEAPEDVGCGDGPEEVAAFAQEGVDDEVGPGAALVLGDLP
jgi:hypothetical protein